MRSLLTASRELQPGGPSALLSISPVQTSTNHFTSGCSLQCNSSSVHQPWYIRSAVPTHLTPPTGPVHRLPCPGLAARLISPSRRHRLRRLDCAGVARPSSLTTPTKCGRKSDRRTAGASSLQRITDHSTSNPSPWRRQLLYLIDFARNRRLVSGLSAACQRFA